MLFRPNTESIEIYEFGFGHALMRYHLHSETSRYGNFGNVNKMPSLSRNTVSQYMNNTDKYGFLLGSTIHDPPK